MFKIKAIGGIGQIGANCSLVTIENKNILIDAGVLFPIEEGLGLNVLIPRFEQIESLDAVIITHGHEDHIGAFKFLLIKFPNTKKYTTRFTLSLLEKKGIDTSSFVSINSQTSLDFHDWTIEPIFVDHSIPDNFGLSFQNKKLDLCAVFLTDFKVNVKGKSSFEILKLKDFGQKYSSKIMFLDSTNILSSQLKTPEEFELLSPLKEIFKSRKSRIFATFFPSNLERMQIFLDLAFEFNLKVFPLGGSVNLFLEVGMSSGKLRPRCNFTDNFKDKNTLVLVSGCQGDYFSALRNLVLGEGSSSKFTSDDFFIYSAKVIPGNEKKVGRIFNMLTERNVKIFDSDKYFTHVSGHPGKSDLEIVINAFNPNHIAPIHTESFFVPEFLEWASLAFPKINLFHFKNGEQAVYDGSNFVVEKNDLVEFDLVHDCGIVMDRKGLKERRKMSECGIVFISIDSKSNIPKYKFLCEGLPVELIDTEDFDSLIYSSLKNLKSGTLEEQITKKAKEYFMGKYSFKPVIRTLIF